MVATNEISVLSESETPAIVFGANVVVFAAAKHEIQNLSFGKAAVERLRKRRNLFHDFSFDGSLEPHVLFSKRLPGLLGFVDAPDGLG